jgi:Flp pilus assembly protein TadD
MKYLPGPICVAVAIGLLALSACEDIPIHIQPLNIERSDGSGKPLGYDALMRIGAAAMAAGDLANAVTIYRRAASVDPQKPGAFVALAGALLQMGSVNEAIETYNSALKRAPHDPAALRGLAKAYLKTARPELADTPLSLAYQDTPKDPKLLLLIGVANDYAGNHQEAQSRYRQGLDLAPREPALTIDLALSLALSEDYAAAISLLQPLATSPAATAEERQTLALVYGLKGDRAQAERLGRIDLDRASVAHNLAFFDTLRNLSPEARSRAIFSVSSELSAGPHS